MTPTTQSLRTSLVPHTRATTEVTRSTRGRRFKLPAESGDMAAAPDRTARMAWVLSTHRLASRADSFDLRRVFVAALRHQANYAVHESAVCRWELGSVRIPEQALAAYEAVLALPPGHLQAARTVLTPLNSEAGGRGMPRGTVDALIDAALTSDCDGMGWLELARAITGEQGLHLRATVWSQLASTLLDEYAGAEGHERLIRRAALRLLMGSGEASHAFSEAVSERLLRDGSVCTHMCSLVGYLPPRVASVVVQDLLEDGGASALACAAHVIADLLAAGQINSQQENAYVTVARERLAQTPHDSDWLLVLGALAERRPRLIGHIIELDPESRRILDERSTVSAARASVYVRQLVEHVRRLAPRTLAAAEDDMVGPLMMEAIFHASFARRQDAAIALMCSPYRPAVAAAVDTALAQDDGSATAGLQQLASWVDDGYGPVPQV